MKKLSNKFREVGYGGGNSLNPSGGVIFDPPNKDWYEQNIENNIREQVKLLRNNGINTTCSCGHKKYIECEVYSDKDIFDAYNILIDNNYENFTIEELWTLSPQLEIKSRRFMVINFE